MGNFKFPQSYPDLTLSNLVFCKYADDENLRLREFFKSLTDKAYSWFVNLPANSIKDWDKLVNAFCTKFFIFFFYRKKAFH